VKIDVQSLSVISDVTTLLQQLPPVIGCVWLIDTTQTQTDRQTDRPHPAAHITAGIPPQHYYQDIEKVLQIPLCCRCVKAYLH